MYYFKKHIFIILCILCCGISPLHIYGQIKLVHNKSELEVLMPTLKAGDSVRLASGIWKDVSLAFRGKGEATKPIVFESEKVGQTIFVGNSKIVFLETFQGK